jgi:hypothetical protein
MRGFGLLVLVLVFAVPLGSHGQSARSYISSGTGFIVSSDGYVLTNDHVVRNATQVTVRVGREDYVAEIVQTDADNDLALLRINAGDLPQVAFGDSDQVRIGDTVYTIGCPQAICGTITRGTVANVNVGPGGMILVDLTATHGSSGGPLLNALGEVIGVTTAGLLSSAQSEAPSGFTLAVPISRAYWGFGVGSPSSDETGSELDLASIAAHVGPAVVFVRAVGEIPLADLMLPEAEFGSISGERFVHGFSPYSSCLDDESYGLQNAVPERYEIEEQGGLSGSQCPFMDACLEVFDLASASDAVQVMSLLQGSFAARYEIGVVRCDCWSDRLFTVKGWTYRLVSWQAKVAGYEASVALLVVDSWYRGLGVLQFCERSDVDSCVSAGRPQDPVAVVLGGIATWTIGDLLFVALLSHTCDPPATQEGYADVHADVLNNLLYASITHTLSVLQSP